MQNTYTKEKDLENLKEKAKDYTSSAMKEGEERVRSTIDDLEGKLRKGEEQMRQLISSVDEKLHENPWPIVTGVAVGCLFLGFIMGTSKRV